MGKKLTIEFIKKQFEREGYVLVSTDYINMYQKLEYVCSNGHEHNITWHDWRNSRRCPYCYGNAKLTIEFVRTKFAEEDYVMTTCNYKNSKQKLYYVCPNGHTHSITWKDWTKNRRCPKCADIEWSINFSNSNNPNWKGGISRDPYCFEFGEDLKEYIKQRDGYKCMNPCCNSKNPNNLCIHHIDYNKKSCGPENLITLCRSCNSEANKDREWHTAWYQAIIYRGYKYIYYGQL